MKLLLFILATWNPLITHPVKDEATHEMLRVTAQEADRAVREEANIALRQIESGVPVASTNRLGPVDTRAWTPQDVLQNLNAPAIHIQEAAVRAVSREQATAAIPLLLPLLQNEDELLRRTVCETLAAIGAADRAGEVVKAVGQLLEVEPSTRNRTAAVAVLTTLRGEPAWRELVRLLQHARWQARQSAVTGIALWNDPAVVELLHPLLEDKTPAVQVAVADALGRLKNPASEAILLAYLPTATGEAQLKAGWALGELRSVGAVPFLVDWVKSTNDAQGVVAAEALGRIEDDRVIPALRHVITLVMYQQLNTRVVALRLLRERAVPGLAPRLVQFVTEAVVPPPPLMQAPLFDTVPARVEALRYLAEFGTRADGEKILSQLKEVLPAELRPPLAATLTKLLQKEYRPLPDHDYRRHFVESRSPSPYSMPPPPGVTAGE